MRLPLYPSATAGAPSASETTSTARRVATTLFSHGFRPFFLFAGIYAAASLALWIGAWAGVWNVPGSWVPMWWHGHELVFGFVGAAICGFLLTAVPQWTGTRPLSGAPLVALVGLWAIGRMAMIAATALPAWLVMIADVALWPALLGVVAAPIARARKPRNYGIAAAVLALGATNVLTHLQPLRGDAALARQGLLLSVYLVAALIATIGGRIVPAFTANALRRNGARVEVQARPYVGRAAVIAVAVAGLARALPSIDPRFGGAAALVATGLLAWRASGWRLLHTLRDPLLWVLHVGHGWLIVGFGLAAIADLTGLVPGSAALHALTAGAMGTMVLAVMTRASLGHTGRPLIAPWPIPAAYIAVIAAAAVRVVAPMGPDTLERAGILTAGVAWTAGFGVFAVVYAPMLLRPRLDEKPA